MNILLHLEKNIIKLIVAICLLGSPMGNMLAQAPKIENLATPINSSYDEHSPVLSTDGKSMYFVRVGHPGNVGGKDDKGDIWFSTLDEENKWSVAQNLGAPVNNASKNGVVGISADGQTLYLNFQYGKNLQAPLKPGLSYTKKSTSGWEHPESWEIEYFQNKSDHQSICISADGKVMVMSIESFGTYGAEDLYVSFKKASGSWSEPKNLGGALNTSFQELTPFLSSDNKTLYFSSNGHGGIGSRDIFASTRLDGTWKNWSKPKNLGPDVNSEGMEMYFTIPVQGDYGYLMSTRNSDGYGDINRVKINGDFRPDSILAEDGMDEIYAEAQFQVPDTVIVFTQEIADPVISVEEEPKEGIVIDGMVLNAKNNEPISAIIQYSSLPGNKILAEKKSLENGKFEVSLPFGATYKVTLTAPGFLTVEEEVTIESNQVTPFRAKYVLSPLEIGTTVQLKDVLFGQGTAELLENSFPELDKVVKLMQQNPNLVIELGGHTDNMGSSKLNLKLSRDRVEMVKMYMVRQGIEASRISGKGYGGLKPIASNKNEQSRKLNRRVDFTIIKN